MVWLQMERLQTTLLSKPSAELCFRIRFRCSNKNLKPNRGISIMPVFFLLLSLLFGSVYAMGGTTKEWVTEPVSDPALTQRIFYSQHAHANVSYHFYLPPEYLADDKKSFPVIYWLHAHKGGTQWIPVVLEYYARAMEHGCMPQAIVVFPNGMGESMWVDSKDGSIPMESIVVNDLVADVDSHLRTIRDPKGRLVEGFSMGGYGAGHLGMKYPGIFGAVSMLGAGPLQLEFTPDSGPREKARDRERILQEVYGGDQSYFRRQSPWALAEEHAVELRKSILRIAVGTRDSMLQPNKKFSEHLKELDIPHEFIVVEGARHNAIELFYGMGDRNWEFYDRAFTYLSYDSNSYPNASDSYCHKTIDDSQKVMLKFRLKKVAHRIRGMDRNNDGEVELEEINPRMRPIFNRIDSNGDGVLTNAEISYFEEHGTFPYRR